MADLLMIDEKTREKRPSELTRDDLYDGQINFFTRASYDGVAMQQILAEARAVVIGGGVIGSHLLSLLADSGVGTLKILDATKLEESSIAGNALLRPEDLTRSRGDALKERVDERNPYLKTESIAADPLSTDDLKHLFRETDCVFVCLDSPDPAVLDAVNAAALDTGTRWLPGQIYRGLGLVGPTVIPGQSPCYKCYELRRDINLNNYEETVQYESRLREMPGMRNECVAPRPLAALVAAFLGLEALRLLTGASYPQTVGRILHLGFFGTDFSDHLLLRFPNCPACGYTNRRRLPQMPQLPRRK